MMSADGVSIILLAYVYFSCETVALNRQLISIRFRTIYVPLRASFAPFNSFSSQFTEEFRTI